MQKNPPSSTHDPSKTHKKLTTEKLETDECDDNEEEKNVYENFVSHVSLSHPNRMGKGRRVKVLCDTKKFRCTPTYFVGTILKDIASSPSSSSLFSSQQDESRRWQIEYDDGQMSTEDVSEKVSNAFPVGTRVRQYLNGTPGGNYGLFGVVVDWDGGE